MVEVSLKCGSEGGGGRGGGVLLPVYAGCGGRGGGVLRPVYAGCGGRVDLSPLELCRGGGGGGGGGEGEGEIAGVVVSEKGIRIRVVGEGIVFVGVIGGGCGGREVE